MFIRIGHTTKAHGIKGELKVSIEPSFLEDFLKNERIFIDVKGAKVPYFVDAVRGSNDMIVQLEDVADRDAAIVLQSREIFLRESDLIPANKRELDIQGSPFATLVGYAMLDEEIGEIGEIEEIRALPHQEIALLQYKGKAVLVPLNEQFIQRIDHSDKRILVSLPAGLLDL